MTDIDTNILTTPIWTTAVYPLAPSEANAETYRSLIEGDKVLLLGCTKLLLPMVTKAVDLVARYPDPKIEVGDWLKVYEYYDTVLLDGGLALDEDLCNALLIHYSAHCKRLVSRCFTKKHPTMKIATYFPDPRDFVIVPHVHSKTEHYMFCIWDF